MNYLNGGYVMVKHDATQAELQKAFESKRPVIAYDSDNRGQFATISESGGTYTLTLLKDGGGSSTLAYATINAKDVNNYMVKVTILVDDLTLETYDDLKTYLSSHGFDMTNGLLTGGYKDNANVSPNTTVVYVDLSDTEHPIYVGYQQYIYDDEDFSITYLGN